MHKMENRRDSRGPWRVGMRLPGDVRRSGEERRGRKGPVLAGGRAGEGRARSRREPELAVQADEARLKAADAKEKELLQVADEKTVLSATLRGELQRAGENEALYKSLAMRLKSVVDTGDLSIVVRAGRMVLRLPNDVLFDSGSAELKPAGKKTLGYIASVLATVPGRRFQVAGHTDTQTIQTSRFPSNWELSTARAVQVVHFLVVDGGSKPTLLSAAGYGEFDPVAPKARSRTARRIAGSRSPCSPTSRRSFPYRIATERPEAAPDLP